MAVCELGMCREGRGAGRSTLSTGQMCMVGRTRVRLCVRVGVCAPMPACARVLPHEDSPASSPGFAQMMAEGRLA